jgi:hypothetical protein
MHYFLEVMQVSISVFKWDIEPGREIEAEKVRKNPV